MRIRSIRPEFWSSEDIAAMDWHTRLLFIGLWSYVDDNGVGRDLERLIVADLFPLDEDPHESLARVSRGLQTLSEGGQIVRYEVDDKPYLHITNWLVHQRVDKRAKDRYPLPTCENASIRGGVARPSRETPETVGPGEGEKGRRGEGEKSSIAQPQAVERVHATRFDEFWNHFPRKVGKDKARTAYESACKRAAEETIVQGAIQFANDPNLPEKQFIPHPTTWLNRGGWDDEPLPPRSDGRGPTRLAQNMAVAQRAWEREQAQTRLEIEQ